MIGKAIYSVLKNSTQLTALVGSKIYPYAIEEKAELPAVVYRIPIITPEYTKCGVVEEENKVEVLAISNSYANCLDIGAAIRTALENKKEIVETVNIVQSRIESLEEVFDFESNVYMNKISFTIKTQK